MGSWWTGAKPATPRGAQPRGCSSGSVRGAASTARGWASPQPNWTTCAALVPATAATSVEQAQQLGCTIGRFHDSAASFREGIDEVQRFARELTSPTVSRLALLTTLVDLQLRIGDLDAAAAVLAVADELRGELGAVPDWDDAGVDRVHGDLLLREGKAAAAADVARAALAGSRSPRGRSRLWNLLGMASISQGDLAAAYEAFTEELSLSQELGHEPYIASAHGNLAEVAMRRGDEPAAARHQAAALELAVQLGVTVMVAYSLIVAARIEGSHGEWSRAVTLHAAADRLLEETGAALYDDDRRMSDAMLEGPGQGSATTSSTITTPRGERSAPIPRSSGPLRSSVSGQPRTIYASPDRDIVPEGKRESDAFSG